MPAVTVPKTALAFGAGYIYYAPLATSLPSNTVVSSVFTDSWPSGWEPVGVTREGHEFTYNLETEAVEAAEYLDPLLTVSTGRKTGMQFDLMQLHATNIRRMLNGGTLTTAGSGSTLLSTYTPPQIGEEVRCMIGWESTDNTERVVAEQTFQAGSLTISRKKGAANASLAGLSFMFEPNADGDPFTYYSCGTVRG